MTSKNLNWLNVLLVDDSTTILKYVANVLETNFNIVNIHCASSAPEAMQILRQSKNINVLFLDLNMPNVDGIQLLAKISKLKYTGYIVLMSGISTRVISSVEQLTKNYGLNYIGTLLKPMHESDFPAIIDKLGVTNSKKQAVESLKTYEIVRAIKNDDIQVLYQPQIHLTTREFIGVEALCRMNHPRLGTVSPDQFINKAEESELIIHITLAVLKKSFSAWQRWHKLGLTIKLAINASPIALQQKEFADTIFNLLKRYSVPAKMLCIEVTESILADNQQQELMNLNRLNMRGVEIALDDFGKDNSTVDRLQKLPLTYLKLDKSYFIDNKNSLGQLSLINTSLSLANKLNIKTIAEGIEDSESMNLVTEMGCDFAQGYYISKPISADKLLEWHHSWSDKT